MSKKSDLVAEELPPHCGYPWTHGTVLSGCGCAKPFKSWNEIYRCVDCNVPMHRACLIHHFGDGKTHDLGTEAGKIKSMLHTPHHFALQIAWTVDQVIQRDNIIAELTDVIEKNGVSE